MTTRRRRSSAAHSPTHLPNPHTQRVMTTLDVPPLTPPPESDGLPHRSISLALFSSRSRSNLTNVPSPSKHAITSASSEIATERPQGPAFWLIFVSLCFTTFLSALDTTSFSTALPTIVADLRGKEFLWVGISYTLASTAFLPMTGGLAQVFGRKPVLMVALALFGIGSVTCGTAKSLNVLIAGRAIQGVGGGGIVSLSEIIISDLVSLKQRGLFTGIVSGVWAFASAIGPPVGGAFSEVSWRWLFFMNIPITMVAFTLVYCFLNLKQPHGAIKSKVQKMDWIGSGIIVGSSSIFVVALSYEKLVPWGLIPLSTGIIGFITFFWYEARVAQDPTIPWELMNNRTSLSGYLATFFHAIASSAVIFYMPIYFQAAKGKSPSQAGVAVFGSVFSVTPAAIICGLSVAHYGVYRPQNLVGWMICIIGFGLLSILHASSPPAAWVGFQVVGGIGLGILYSSPKFPILAPLPLEKNANALAFFSFARKFSGIWGITIGSAILENQLARNLPQDFLVLFPEGSQIAYAAIPQIGRLPEPLKTNVQAAFATSIRWIWLALIGVSTLGLCTVALMKEVPMHAETDQKWGIEDKDTGAEIKVVSIDTWQNTPARPSRSPSTYTAISWQTANTIISSSRYANTNTGREFIADLKIQPYPELPTPATPRPTRTGDPIFEIYQGSSSTISPPLTPAFNQSDTPHDHRVGVRWL